MAARQQSSFTIKTIWGLAKCPELALDKDTLYALIERETGKDSMRQLTQAEIDRVCRELGRLKSDAAREAPPDRRYRRSDEGGNPETAAMRRKIYVLAKEMGWSDNDVNALAFSIFGISRQEWLDVRQCSGLISALRRFAARRLADARQEG
jgi:hypothetical protein